MHVSAREFLPPLAHENISIARSTQLRRNLRKHMQKQHEMRREWKLKSAKMLQDATDVTRNPDWCPLLVEISDAILGFRGEHYLIYFFFF